MNMDHEKDILKHFSSPHQRWYMASRKSEFLDLSTGTIKNFWKEEINFLSPY